MGRGPGEHREGRREATVFRLLVAVLTVTAATYAAGRLVSRYADSKRAAKIFEGILTIELALLVVAALLLVAVCRDE